MDRGKIKAVIADTKPCSVELKKGAYFWCACGRSKKQPFCDGAHAGSGLDPLMFELAEDQVVHLCCCKQTKNAPYCDGSHQGLSESDN